MDFKKSLTIVMGVLLVAVAVLVIAAVVFNLINGNLAGSPTPAPSATPGPSSTPPAPGATATPAATSGATPTGSPAPTVTAPIYVGAVLNRTSGMCLVTIMLTKDAPPVDTSRLSMDIVCDGQSYRNVWAPKPYDWGNADTDAMLEFGETLSPQIDTAVLGIPQNRPLTIKIIQNGAELQQVTVTPS